MRRKSGIKEIDLKAMGRRIRTQRDAIHMTRKELAAKLGITDKFVADIEYGEKGMSINSLYKMTQALNLSADYILRGESAAGDGSDPEVERIKENILGPLSTCTTDQLECMEQITKYYVEAIVGTGK